MVESIKALAGAYKGTLILIGVGALGALFIGTYVKGRFDGAGKERGKWEAVQEEKRLEQAAERRKAQLAINKLAEKQAETEKQGRDNLQAALQEAEDAQEDFEAQSSIMEDQLFELQQIIITLQDKNVDPKVIERIKTIRINKPTNADRARNERLRGSLNSIR